MKRYINAPLLAGCLFSLFLFSSCNKVLKPETDPLPEPEIPVNELKLSVEGYVYTDDIEYEFEILEGNGDYTVQISPGTLGRAVIEGMKVKVTLLESSTGVTVADGKGQSESIVINSSSEILSPISYSVYMQIEDGPFTMQQIHFGVGGYSIERIEGNSVRATIQENGRIHLHPLTQGNSYFEITDKRGSKAPLIVMVGTNYELTTGSLEVQAVNDQTFSVILKYGTGGWLIDPLTPSSPIISRLEVLSHGSADMKYDVLRVDTSRGNVKGSAMIRLKDSAGTEAVITVTVK